MPLSKEDSVSVELEKRLSHKVRDTIFILDDHYIEVDLKDQIARLIIKNDSTYTYKISSGNPHIHKGMSTPSGIFTVQNKTPMATSRQFNNAQLHFWIGFNMNIGFHGLTSNGYYRHLGNRPSSHGCLRIGRKEGEDLYNRIRRGTPVIVYDSLPARIFSFADPGDFDPRHDEFICRSNKRQFRDIDRILDHLEKGEYYVYRHKKYFLHPDTIMKPRGLKVGYAGDVADYQRKPIHKFRHVDIFKDDLNLVRQQRYFISDSVLSASALEEVHRH